MLVNQWTLNVKEFGKIQDAKITVSPFMMFVGKNNSGKSYLMLLLWGILNETDDLISDLFDNPKLMNFSKKLTGKFQELKKGESIKVDNEVLSGLLELFNEKLMIERERLLKKIFNHPVTIGSIRIERETYPDISIRYLIEESKSVSPPIEEGAKAFIRIRSVLTVEYCGEKLFTLRFPSKHLSPFSMQFLLLRLLKTLIGKDFYDKQEDRIKLHQPLYLPASRTGFMHTYRAILGNAFESMATTRPEFEELEIELEEEDQNYASAPPGTELTLPTTYFLSKLQKHNINEEQVQYYQEELRFLNENILKGRVIKDERGRFRFTPANTEYTLPLHVTSSLVAELAPISVFLESQWDPDLWIIEEIESHLHSDMQLEIARLLFRLINKGKAVWLTTHSDNLAQQVNNLLTLSRHPKKEHIRNLLRYEQADLLTDPTISRAYQFETNSGITTVEELRLSDYGFVMKTFNDTLSRLIHETEIIQDFTEET